MWVNKTSGEMYILTDDTTNANVWTNVGGGTGDIIVNVLPGMPDNNFASSLAKSITHNHTFIGGTDTGSSNSDISGAVTHYVVDQISNAALTVTASEVAAGNPHVFTTSNVGSNTNITFRVRSKDNDGGFSADRIISVTINAYTGMVATGGTITTNGDYKVHSFTTSGSFSFNVTTAGSTPEVEYLVIAGGGSGGGGNDAGGGGGAGGYRTATGFSVSATSYNVVVGGGGAAYTGTAYHQGNDGTDSTFATITSTGGGGGGHLESTPCGGRDGGSGGGASFWHNNYASCASTAGQGIAGQGNDGGSSSSGDPYRACGGGGAGAVGQNGNTGTGGAGLASDILITGQNVLRAGGGGGGTHLVTPTGSGGSGGGGRGGKYQGTNSTPGDTNTGSGGGGGTAAGGSGGTGAGGSGIVILRYKFQ
jgi:hypothetical protein